MLCMTSCVLLHMQLGSPLRDKGEEGFEEILIESFLDSLKTVNPYVQEAQEDVHS